MAADSPATLQYQIDCLRDSLCQPETEDSWNKIARAIESLSTLCVENSEEYHSVVTSSVRSLSRPITSAMVSERTRLSGTAVDFVGSIATSLERNFESLAPVFIPSLLLLCSRANKVFVNRAKACLSIIIEMTQLASLLPYFVQAVKDKSATLRLAAAEAGLACLNSCNPQDLEKESRIRDMESMIRSTAKDASADVRKVGKKLFQAFQALMPDRVPAFAAPLSPTMRKYLELPAGPVHKQSQPNLRTLVKSKSHAHLSSSTSALSRSTSPTLSSVGQRPVPERPASSMSRAPPVPSHGISRLRNEMGPPALPHTRSQPSHPTRPMSTLSRSASAMERPKSVIMPSVKAMREPIGLSSSDFPAAVPRPRVAGAIRVRPESIHGMPSTAMSPSWQGVYLPPSRRRQRKRNTTHSCPSDLCLLWTPLWLRRRPSGPWIMARGIRRLPLQFLGRARRRRPEADAEDYGEADNVGQGGLRDAKDRASAASKPSVSRQASATIQPGSRFAPSRSASSSHAPSVKSSSPAEEEVAASQRRTQRPHLPPRTSRRIR
ncbi:clasp N terminal-domain-containing protein [Schizophyllum amplum]|uniref:Clasp N terminal-domain-containing protein n=1 Tax=Schizophyllum amplum TaxID=97359 RepID=A0A550C3M8_9AGAR|nr:clasp N terminal-domain-containing protein [Auriculariopsis ampla]